MRKLFTATAVAIAVASWGSGNAFAAGSTASFSVSPALPAPGQSVTFSSTSTGTSWQAWDLDDDGHFDDGTAITATRVFAASGTYTVRLVTVGADGQLHFATKQVTADQPPVARFDFSPGVPIAGRPISLTSTATDVDGVVSAHAWSVNGAALAQTPGATFTPLTGGTYSVRLTVTDDDGATATVTRTITVDQPPVAAFGVAPVTPIAGQNATLTSTSTDSDGHIEAVSWDLNGDGTFGDATTGAADHTFTTGGRHDVGLRVTDDKGAATTITKTVVVDQPPVVGFGVSPGPHFVGDSISFDSNSFDGDGTLAAQLWDIDGDGTFGDQRGPAATSAFDTAGAHIVGLRVVDDMGAAAVAFVTVEVSEKPQPPVETGPAPAPDASRTAALIGPSWITPFPVVILEGTATRHGARITKLSALAPRGTLVQVRCVGRRCPAKRITKDGAGTRAVRFRKFERAVPAASVIQVRVSRPGMIGKYVAFRIRRLKVPSRTDRCLLPGSAAPQVCP
jgi:hypothetical protein